MKARASETGSLPGRNARFVFGTEWLVFGVYVLSNKERWAMFEDSLVESSGRLRQRDRWSTAVSFTVQVAFIGLLVLLPLIYTEGLPKQQLVSIVEAPSPPAAPAQHLTPHPGRPSKPIDQGGNRVLAPRAIPKVIAIVHDELTGPPELRGVVGEVPGGVPAALMSLLPHTFAAVPTGSVPSKILVSSGVAEGRLIYQVEPQYPTLARQARIQGIVVLQAVIGKDGTVQRLHVISGHPMLRQAAIEAVKQWRYKPYFLDGEPVEVDTQVNVNFMLSGGQSL